MPTTSEPHMSCQTSSGEVTPHAASARVGRLDKDSGLRRHDDPHASAGAGGHSPSKMTAASRWATERSPAPRPAPGPLGRPPRSKTPGQLSIDQDPPTDSADDHEGELLVVNFTPSKDTSTTAARNKAQPRTASSLAAYRLNAKGEPTATSTTANLPSWTERRPSRGEPRPSSRASGRCASASSRGVSPSSLRRASLFFDEARDFDEQQRKFRIVRSLFASHEDGVRFCIVLDQLLAARAIATEEFEARLKLLPKHEATRLRALKEKTDAHRRAREDKIWDVENVVRRAVPTEPPAMLAKLFNKGTSTDTAQTERPTRAAERAAHKEKTALARQVADLEKALQESQKDNAELKKDLAAAQAKSREADLVQSARPTTTLPRGGSSPAFSPSNFSNEGDVWGAIEELRRAVALLNQRVGSIEQCEQLSLLEAIAQLRRDLQQLDQRAALMEGRQRAALGW